MITEKVLLRKGYTIYVTLNNGMKHKGGELIVHGTIVRDGETTHQSIGKTNQDDWLPWVDRAAAAVAAAPPVLSGIDLSDWK